jgi:nucleoside-diphosphate-sugar epimerase
VPLTETSELRTRLHPYPPDVLQRLRKIFGWLDDVYDKILVEREILASSDIEGIVLRLPIVYGPGDPMHRMFPMVKRMDDRRPIILLPDDLAAWRPPRGYVANVAAAIALAATVPRLPSNIYNVAEPNSFPELEWTRKLAAAAGWNGEIVVLPRARTPHHLVLSGNLSQHWAMNSDRIHDELGYVEPVPLEEAIRRTIAWERSHPPAEIDAARFDYAAEDVAWRSATA